MGSCCAASPAALPIVAAPAAATTTAAASNAKTMAGMPMHEQDRPAGPLLQGTPTPGGVIDTILKSARPSQPEPRTEEGAWRQVKEGAATLLVDVHGSFPTNQSIVDGLRSGKLIVDQHDADSIHLHDTAT